MPCKICSNYKLSLSSVNETLEVDIDAEDNQDDDNTQDDYIEMIKLKNGPGTMRKKKTEAILQTRRYKVHSEQRSTTIQNFFCIIHV